MRARIGMQGTRVTYGRSFHVLLALATLLTVIATGVSATPVRAAAGTAFVAPDSGPPGTVAIVVGSGWPGGHRLRVTLWKYTK